jgi:acetoin utilization deacetylase AcuC-like enzyme
MRSPQEIPERAVRLVAACRSMEFEILEPADFGMAPIAAVHDANYLTFLEAAHREWKKMPEDWGGEVMSNVYVYEIESLEANARAFFGGFLSRRSAE